MRNWYDMAPPGAGFARRKSTRSTSDRLSAISYRVNELRIPAGGRAYFGTLLRIVLRVSLDTQTAHDFQQTGVVGEAELLGGLGHVPVVALQGLNHDLALRFLLLLFEGA